MRSFVRGTKAAFSKVYIARVQVNALLFYAGLKWSFPDFIEHCDEFICFLV